MKRNPFLFAVWFALAGSANADILASGPINGGQSQTTATCYLFNAGAGTVSISSEGIRRGASTAPLALTHDFCGSTLASGASCVIQANTAFGDAHSCRFVVSPSGADVRGSFEVRDSIGNILNQADMR